jgi:predicted small secreted protein
MKRIIISVTVFSILLCSCGTSAGDGAYLGSGLGSILGSAIGGITGGPRGSDIGTLIGMAGGAVVGATVANSVDKEQHIVPDNRQVTTDNVPDDVVDESNSGDDRIYDFNSPEYTTSKTTQMPISNDSLVANLYKHSLSSVSKPRVEIRNARFIDDNSDGKIQRGELSKVIFEVINHGSDTLSDVQPIVKETTGNKHIKISAGIHIETILPNNGIRYTALVFADKRLSVGNIKLSLSVIANGREQASSISFVIPTIK